MSSAKKAKNSSSDANANASIQDADALISSSSNGKAPETNANFFSKLVFAWAQPLFRAASDRHKLNQGLEQEDLLPLIGCDLGSHIGPIFEKAWSDQVVGANNGNDTTSIRNSNRITQANNNPTIDTTVDSNKARLSKAIRAVVGRRFIIAGFIKIINTLLQFAFPILVNAILRFIEKYQNPEYSISSEDPWYIQYEGYWLSALLFLAMGSKAITENIYFHAVYRASYQTRVAVSVAVYNKALRLTSSERHGTTLGELVNLMQVDASKIEMFIIQYHVLWDGMLQIIGYMAILYTLIGWPCFAGLGIMVLAIPVSGIIMKRLFGLNRSMVKYTDDRVKTTNEAIQGIRCVKMYTWEESFQKVIAEGRKEELDILKRMAYLRGASRAYMGALPNIVAVVSFVVYAVANVGDITASTLFAALVAFGQLRFPLLFYPMALAQWAQAKVSINRVEKFLKLNEVKNDKSIYNRSDESMNKGAVKVNNATIYWRDPDTPIDDADDSGSDTSSLSGSNHSSSKKDKKVSNVSETNADDSEVHELKYPQSILDDVNFSVAAGDLVAIIGRVGSGKSTLTSALLNEAVIGDGSIALNGKIAYAAQSPWILNATLRDNITFGEEFDRNKYEKVITACQLLHDLEMLDNGDLTEIGENGINLSGGQRQRVSIARAAYSEADIIVLDDPLSALDPEVGKKLFDECIVNLMKNSTRVLVTNQLQFLKFCDTVVALDKGTISEQGTFDEISKNDGEVAKLLNDLEAKQENSTGETEGTSKPSKKQSKKEKKTKNKEVEVKKNSDGGLVTEEERNVGAVSGQVYKKYIVAGGGFLVFTFTFFLFILCAANDLLNSLWLTFWTSDANYEKQSQFFYLGFYALLSVTAGFFVFFRSMSLARFGVFASEKLHQGLLVSVLKAPMSFFDTTPTGRILSRFSKDLYAVDLEITDNLDFAIFAALTVVVSLGSIVIVTPWFGVAIVPIMFLYVKILNFFREVSRETKRLESISRSPVYAHFSETLGGLGTIQAYNQGGRFISNFGTKVDCNTQATYNNRCADRWLSTRLELMGSFIAGLAAAFACSVVINNAFTITENSRNFSSIAGLSLNYAISVTGLLNWVVRTFAQTEASMNAAERILYYTDEIPHEAPSKSEELDSLSKATSADSDDTQKAPLVAVKAEGGVEKLNDTWPREGKIVLKNLKMKYRDETPLVIKGLDVEISGGSRVGVVGRTGSGKSSLLLTLLRIVEPHIENSNTYEAPITIDDVDILRIGLTELRSAVGIIPQNPVLFSGTIRSNMDPFNDFTDEQIWDALDGCGMKSTIEEMPSLLQAPVAEYGDNLSQGQRQLLCLGRALLKKCRVLLLDEATSSVDYETDKEIQQTLRQAFAGCTVLTIAHRVNTIMDSDKILVMVDGKVGEYGNPDDLLGDSNSIFADIVKHAQNESESE